MIEMSDGFQELSRAKVRGGRGKLFPERRNVVSTTDLRADLTTVGTDVVQEPEPLKRVRRNETRRWRAFYRVREDVHRSPFFWVTNIYAYRHD